MYWALPTPKVAADCDVALLIVPAMNGAGAAVQVTLVIAIESPPEIKSPAASTVSVGVLPDPVLTRAVTATVESAGMLGVVVGLASGKLIVVGVKTNSARVDTVALIVRISVSITWAAAGAATQRKTTTK